MLDRIDLEHAGDHAAVLERVITQLRGGAMPPPGMPRPDPDQVRRLATWLEATLDRAAAARPNPGRVPLHRLSRTEYVNAIRDLLDIEIDGSLLPADESLDGFDNMAGVLSVSPALLERYLVVGRRASRLALGDPGIRPGFDTYGVAQLAYQDDRMSEDLPFGSRGGLAVRHRFPVDGEYRITVRLQRTIYNYIRGLAEPNELDIRLDGARLTSFTVGGAHKGTPTPLSFGSNILGTPAWEAYVRDADAGLEVTFQARAGTHTVGVSFVQRPWEPEGVLQPPVRGFAFTINEGWGETSPAVESVSISGPHGVTGSGETTARRKVFVCHPLRQAEEEPCAKKILSAVARRAYRRPATPKDIETLLEFYRDGRARADFEAGIRRAVERILADPDFLFRIEREPAGVQPDTPYALPDLDLASRLSFFLWSSLPDDELLDVAAQGKLTTPRVLDGQIRRMMADRRADALVENFASQWLTLRQVRSVTPDLQIFPDFDENLRDAFHRETQLFLRSQFREDRSVTDMLTADYTFVNERLARHYGIPDVYGSHFRRISLPGENRRGLLGQGSVLMVTSYPNRTSPVLRGKWLLENVLGTPPPPPANAPGLKERGDTGTSLSMRERMEEHRKNPVCAGCHARMDPWGFALENFDGIGAWRARSEAGSPIDATATLPDGTTMDGVTSVRTALLHRREQFAETVIDKMLTYALNRPVEYYDRPVVREITRQAAANDYRWSSAVLGIIRSTPFRMRRSHARSSDTATASASPRRAGERSTQP